MEIYLLRHAIAENARQGQRDSERALTEAGLEKLRRVLKRAAAASVKPDLILSSPYRRALETAAAAAAALDYKGKVLSAQALVPNGSPQDVWEEIRRHRQEAAILLSGHEPQMSALAAFLLNSPALVVDMKKAGLIRVDCDQFGPQPRCVLKWMLTPALAAE
jgi:phosphohistidine phosphatase